ncbi:hypothetical protein [Streptomyces morookaense]|uniref:hypothetical protein n=1 Tax=Streptomyces morookaense TaxID=1970 RepID=UPI0019BA12D5|nr:hypothetical protein [Streptomyces morookaense]GHF27465.1 hypothetical protein GCM10010359_32200 [Streptomyces morookaense]
MAFTNTSGSVPATQGTVVLGTHILDATGHDWATIASTRPLPVPIAPRRTARQTWTVCVDAWRVPPGMHMETRDITVTNTPYRAPSPTPDPDPSGSGRLS